MATVATLGNPHRGDDGIGPWIAAKLRAHGIEPVEMEEPTRIVDVDEADLLVLVDAVISGAPVGSVVVLDVTDRELPGAVTTSSHSVTLGQALALRRQVASWPSRVVVVGVEIEEIHPEPGLHPETEAAGGLAVDLILGVLHGVAR